MGRLACKLASMRKYDTLLAIVLFIIFGLLGYEFGRTALEEKSATDKAAVPALNKSHDSLGSV